MKTIEILSEMNIHFDEATDSLFDYILECKKITTLDMFPKVIHNSRKYQSVEVFYQRVLDRNMKKQEFINIEKRFIDFVMSLWLYNETYVATRDISPVIFYFRNSKIMLLLNGCIGLIYYGLPKEDLLTKQIADNCSLYLY